ncbi:hypothetical protein U1Q18_047334, partial [Sarracenia purpurea var. burkii]
RRALSKIEARFWCNAGFLLLIRLFGRKRFRLGKGFGPPKNQVDAGAIIPNSSGEHRHFGFVWHSDLFTVQQRRGPPATPSEVSVETQGRSVLRDGISEAKAARVVRSSRWR